MDAVNKVRSPGHQACSHKSYFLTCEEYEALLARSKGHCELCGVPASSVPRHGKLVIDHDNRIGWRAVRGLICLKCNSHLRHVDSGFRAPDERTLRYLALSGYVAQPPKPRPRLAAGDTSAEDRRNGLNMLIDRRALDEGLTIRGGEPNRSEMLRLMLAYAQQHMPKGWRPPSAGAA